MLKKIISWFYGRMSFQHQQTEEGEFVIDYKALRRNMIILMALVTFIPLILMTAIRSLSVSERPGRRNSQPHQGHPEQDQAFL